MIDASIVLGGQPVKIDNPMNALANAEALRSARNQNQLHDLALQDRQTARSDKNALTSALKDNYDATTGKINDTGVVNALASSGNWHLIDGYQKQVLANKKTGFEADKVQNEGFVEAQKVAHGRLEAIGGVMGSLAGVQGVTHDQVSNGIQHLVDIGMVQPDMAQKVVASIPADPAMLQGWLKQQQQLAVSAKDQVDFALRKQIADEGNRTKLTISREGNAVTTRGQNLAYARSKESNRIASMSTPFQVSGPDGKDILVQQDKKTGALVPVQGFAPKQSDRAPTEFQGKSATFGQRADEADKILSGLEGKYSRSGVGIKNTLGDTWLIGGALGGAANSQLSPESQKADQAQRNFVNAVLRQESGAAIAPSEFDNAKKQYFPQVGDGPAVVAQKAQNRASVIAGLKNNAGKAALPPSQQSAPLPAGFKIEKVK